MPELPEVETTVRGLSAVLLGRRVGAVRVNRADLRRAFPADLGQRLTGATIVAMQRRAKYGLVATDRDDTLIFHLGMSGRWRLDPDAPLPHDHLELDMADGHRAVLNDPRRFGSVDLVRTGDVADWPPFAAMGPEPLSDGFDGAYLESRWAGRVAPVKAMLLDQRIVAGLGNIYVCEALNMAGIAPTRPAGQIARGRLDALAAAVKTVLLAAIEAGGSTLRDYARPDGQLGYFAKDWRAYGRAGEDCACGGTIERRIDSGRSTFWCPACQR